MKRVELNIHTGYSLLKSSIQLDNLFKTLKERQMDTVGISDYNTTSAFVKAQELGTKYNIKVLLGVELYIIDQESYITLYARDNEGYILLNELATLASMHKGLSLKDLNHLDLNRTCHLNAIMGANHVLLDYIIQRDDALALSMLKSYQSVFPNLYLGIGITTKNERVYQEPLIRFALDHHLIPMAFNAVHYLKNSEYEDYLFVRSVESGHYPATVTEREKYSYLLTDDDIKQGYNLHPELCENTLKFSETCEAKLGGNGYHFPKFKENREESNRYLTELCKYGLNKRLKDKHLLPEKLNAYRERLLYELDIITQMGFSDYFLIVQDFICYAKKQGYRVGLGRGSAPSSLVVYSLGISDIDPLEYNLLFERFLNPQRISMPDIDVDIQDNHRNDIVAYLMNKYGEDRVCEIKALQTFGVKAIIQEVGRLRDIDKTTLKTISQYAPNSLGKVSDFTQNSEVIKLGKAYPSIQYIIDRVNHLYNLPKAITTHAPGVVITDNDLTHYVALEPGPRGLHQAQFDKDDLEKIGLVKMDILSLSNLTMIQDIVDLIKKDYPDFNLEHIPLNDKATYALMAAGDTNNVFQFDSAGMQKFLQRLNVRNFMDLVEANALFRPGPAQMISTFINRKNHREPVSYPHPSLMPILKDTYGVIVFQEQIMLIAEEFAGYSLGEADVLRAAMSHKKEDVIKREEIHFIKGAIAKGHTEEEARNVYQYFLAFASYGFNKSHSVCYALIGYQMAFLKTHFSAYFSAYILSKSLKNDSIMQYYTQFLKKNNITLVSPDINISTISFEVKDNQVVYALTTVNNIPEMVAQKIGEERKNGNFSSYEDFLKRTRQFLNKQAVFSLIDSGALDNFNLTHKGMMDSYESFMNRIQFGILYNDNDLIPVNVSKEEYSFAELASREKEAIGVNLKYNALALLDDKRLQYKTIYIKDAHENPTVNLLFTLVRPNEVTTKTGKTMMMFSAVDDSGQMDGVIFPTIYQQYKDIINKNNVFVAQGAIEIRENKKQFVLREIYFFA